MNLFYTTHSFTGTFHLSVAILALLFGTIVLWAKKGTQFHKRAGYLYAINMILLNITAFMLYNLTGKFNVFHIAAIVSSATLLSGFVPILLKKPINGYMDLHIGFMYWSVIGLYAAFVSETAVRIPSTPFWGAVGFGTAIVMFFASIIFAKKRHQWETTFSPSLENNLNN